MEEKILNIKKNGMCALLLILLSEVLSIVGIVYAAMNLEKPSRLGALYVAILVVCILWLIFSTIP